MVLFQIICIILNLLLAFILHNSEYVGYYGNTKPIPFKQPLIVWCLWGVGILIPIVSCIIFIIIGIWMLVEWREEHRIKWPDNHWLFKKY